MKRKEKEIFISQVVNELKEQKIFFFANFQGVKTEEINELRRRLSALSWGYRVVRNTIFKRVFKILELENVDSNSLDKFFQGPTALVFKKSTEEKKNSSSENSDPVEASKILLSFIKTHPNFRISAGFIAGRVLTQEEIANLAKLPSREVLLRQIISGLQFPLVRLVNVLQAPLGNLIYLLDQKSKKRSGSEVNI